MATQMATQISELQMRLLALSLAREFFNNNAEDNLVRLMVNEHLSSLIAICASDLEKQFEKQLTATMSEYLGLERNTQDGD